MPTPFIEKLHAKIEKTRDAEDREIMQRETNLILSAGIKSYAQLLRTVADPDADITLRTTALKIIKYIGDRKAGSALLTVILNENELLEFRRHAAKALRYRCTSSVAKPLMQLVETHPNLELRCAVANALQDIWYGGRDEFFCKILMDKTLPAELRSEAAEGLAKSCPDKYVASFVPLLQDNNPAIRFWMCYIIGQKAGADVIPHLEKLMDDPTKVIGTTIGQEASDTIQKIRARS